MQSVLIKILKFVHLHKEMLGSVKWRGGEKGDQGRKAGNTDSTEQPK